MKRSFEYDPSWLTRPSMLAFTQIADAWELTEAERSLVLGRPIESVSDQLKADLLDDKWRQTLERLSHLIAIYRLLHTIFRNAEQADSWVRRPNSAASFNGATALELMCTGQLNDLVTVRQFLED